MEFIASCLMGIGFSLLVWIYFGMFARPYYYMVSGAGLFIIGMSWKIVFCKWCAGLMFFTPYLTGFEMQMMAAFAVSVLVLIAGFISALVVEYVISNLMRWVQTKLLEVV